MNKQKVYNYVGQILELTGTLKRQPPNMRYGIADGISTLARNIKAEVDKEDTNEST